MNTEVKHNPLQFIREERMFYQLHQAGFRNGSPVMCNKYWMSLYFDHANGVKESEANEMAEYIHEAVNNYYSLKEQLSEYEKAYNLGCKKIDELNEQLQQAQEENERLKNIIKVDQASLKLIKHHSEKSDAEVERLREALMLLHTNCLYRIHPDDDRVTHVPHHIFNIVESVLQPTQDNL